MIIIGFQNKRNKRKGNFEFQFMNVVGNYDFENHPLHANPTEILAFDIIIQ